MRIYPVATMYSPASDFSTKPRAPAFSAYTMILTASCMVKMRTLVRGWLFGIAASLPDHSANRMRNGIALPIDRACIDQGCDLYKT
jgi:hypothetical protein